jgi:glycosyltransferase involved in cell wall biosynthesis
MVGRPTGQKGWDYACAAFRSLEPEETRCIDLVLIGGLGKGNGPYSSYSTQVANDFAKLSFITVHNLGALDHFSTLSHMAAADLLLFPSVFEPLGLVLLEAIASGCCVLASDAAGPSDLLDEPWGISVPFGIPETRVQALTDGLRQFLTWSREDLDERSKMAKAKSELFTWRQCASVHLKALSGA